MIELRVERAEYLHGIKLRAKNILKIEVGERCDQARASLENDPIG